MKALGLSTEFPYSSVMPHTHTHTHTHTTHTHTLVVRGVKLQKYFHTHTSHVQYYH